MVVPSALEPLSGWLDSDCPLCYGAQRTDLPGDNGISVDRCDACGLARLRPQARRERSAKDVGEGLPALRFVRIAGSPTEREAAANYVRLLEAKMIGKGSVLAVVPNGHPFPELARASGHQIAAWTSPEDLEETDLAETAYDAAVIVFQLERASDPIGLLKRVRAALKPDGALLVVAPSLDSWPARLLRASWTEWRRANRYYFDTQTMHGALLRAGFGQVRAESDRRRYSLQHVRDRAHAVPATALTRMVKLASALVPPALRNRMRLQMPTSATIVMARRREQRERPLLSIVMPVYNERASFATTIEAVLRKQVAGIDKEIIVVESASTDGTREAVRQYEGHPEVKVVLQDRPRGKGNAVREGFEHARGDFVLIQDADQEYDVEDYDALLRPLQRYQRPFVLGSRHVRGWKIRQFNDQPGLVELCNVGHRIFLGLLNVIYRQDLKDPFTMYKVFWRDCLYDVHFECNRFDFDFELVIKLLRKGYRPLELPVTYRARSFRDGKKVSMLKDPLTWLRALTKYRFGSIYCSDRRDASTTDQTSSRTVIRALPVSSALPRSTPETDRPRLAAGGRLGR